MTPTTPGASKPTGRERARKQTQRSRPGVSRRMGRILNRSTMERRKWPPPRMVPFRPTRLSDPWIEGPNEMHPNLPLSRPSLCQCWRSRLRSPRSFAPEERVDPPAEGTEDVPGARELPERTRSLPGGKVVTRRVRWTRASAVGAPRLAAPSRRLLAVPRRSATLGPQVVATPRRPARGSIRPLPGGLRPPRNATLYRLLWADRVSRPGCIRAGTVPRRTNMAPHPSRSVLVDRIRPRRRTEPAAPEMQGLLPASAHCTSRLDTNRELPDPKSCPRRLRRHRRRLPRGWPGRADESMPPRPRRRLSRPVPALRRRRHRRRRTSSTTSGSILES